jgi:hypothetical protein
LTERLIEPRNIHDLELDGEKNQHQNDDEDAYKDTTDKKKSITQENSKQ